MKASQVTPTYPRSHYMVKAHGYVFEYKDNEMIDVCRIGDGCENLRKKVSEESWKILERKFYLEIK